MDIIVQQIIPFHSLAYLKEFIEKSQKYKISERLTVKKIHLTFTILFFQSFHFIYQYFFKDFQNLGIDPLIDYIRISNLPREVYIFLIGVCVLSIYYLYLLYCGPFDEVNLMLYLILVSKRNDFFIKRIYREKLIVELAQKFVFVLINTFQGFIVVVGKYFKILKYAFTMMLLIIH